MATATHEDIGAPGTAGAPAEEGQYDSPLINDGFGSGGEGEEKADGGVPGSGDDSFEKVDPKTATEAMKALKKVDSGGTGFLKTSIETMRMADGKAQKSDVYSDDIELALEILQDKVKGAIDTAGGIDSKRGKKWRFRSVPHEQFRLTLDDVFLVFLRWATDKGEASDSGSDKEADEQEIGTVRINVSKAFRRLESYAEWMEDSANDLLAPGPLTGESVRRAWDHWKMKISHDDHKRLIWWFDFRNIDFKECKRILPEDRCVLMMIFSSSLKMIS